MTNYKVRNVHDSKMISISADCIRIENNCIVFYNVNDDSINKWEIIATFPSQEYMVYKSNCKANDTE